MPFQKGQPRPAGAGKKKGSHNLLTQKAIDIMAELKCNPIEGMAKIALNKRNPKELRAKMFAELAHYGYPTLKAIEHSGPAGGPIEHNVSARDILTRRIAGLASRVTEDRNSGGTL